MGSVGLALADAIKTKLIELGAAAPVVSLFASYDTTETVAARWFVVPDRSVIERAGRGIAKKEQAVAVVLMKPVNPVDIDELDALLLQLEAVSHYFCNELFEAAGLRWLCAADEIEPCDPTQLEHNLLFSGRVELRFSATVEI